MTNKPSRRIFIRDFGRGVLGISIGGVMLGACGDGETAPSAIGGTTDASSTTSSAAVTGSSVATDQTSTTTEAVTTSNAPSGSGELDVEAISLGSVSAYLMIRGTEVALVDTGTGGRVGDIGQALSEVGLGWSSVGTVILTHKHGDHVGSLGGVLREVTDAVVGAGAADLAGIGAGPDLVAFEDGQQVFGATIIGTPGHTAGHISVWDATTGVLIAGDALNGAGSGVENVDGVGGPNAGFTTDMSSAIESARKMAALQPDTIFFGHGSPKLGNAASALSELVAGL